MPLKDEEQGGCGGGSGEGPGSGRGGGGGRARRREGDLQDGRRVGAHARRPARRQHPAARRHPAAELRYVHTAPSSLAFVPQQVVLY